MSLGSHVRPLLVSMTIGTVFAGLYAIGRPDWAGAILASGALTGAVIHGCIFALERAFDPFLLRRSVRLQYAGKALIFLVGGVGGWLGGMLLSSRLFGIGMSLARIFSGDGKFIMAITAASATVVGLAFYAYGLLQRRLESTLERLKQTEWAERELELARSIQTRLLPPARIEGDGFTIVARNLPAQFVAGDFYDVVRLDDGSLVIVVADVAGKGVGASLIMASVKAVLPFVARESAPRAMAMLNEKLVKELGKREFVALAYARFQPADGSVELLNAGFPEPYLITSHGVRALETAGVRLPLGVRDDIAYEPLLARIEPGERLVFVSDGIPEAPANGEPLGYERLFSIIASMNGSARGDAWLDAFLDRVREVVDPRLDDDWTAVLVERA